MESIEKIISESTAYSPIEMAQEINLQLAATTARKKDHTKTILLVLIGLIITGTIVYMVIQPPQKATVTSNIPESEN
jgi:hypothetical protein